LAETVFPVSVKNTFPNHFIMPECAKAHLQSRISYFFSGGGHLDPCFPGGRVRVGAETGGMRRGKERRRKDLEMGEERDLPLHH